MFGRWKPRPKAHKGPDAAADGALQSLFDDLPVACLEVDAGGRIVRVNQAHLDLLGYAREEMIGQPVRSFTGEPDAPQDGVLAAWSGRAAAARKFEATWYRKNGTPVPVMVDERLLVDAAGRATGIRMACVDLTERRLAEQSSEQLAMLVTQLEEQSRRNTTLNEMREFLLACSSTGEIGPVVSRSMTRLFPEWAGSLYLLNGTRTDVEPVARWGEAGDGLTQDVFARDDCWSLRKGGAHVVEDMQDGLICQHVTADATASYLCVPLMARGDVLGLLHLRQPADVARHGALSLMSVITEHATTVAGILSLAIWNLRLRATLSEQAIKDPLTGLFNRAFMEDALAREINRARRKNAPVAVIMADVDHFKNFNDTHGHAAGDLVLTVVADLFKRRLRANDVACRYGGEEFTLILPDCEPEAAYSRAFDLREGVKGLRLEYGGSQIGPVTISMGVSVFPAGGGTPRDVVTAADLALYKAKQAGRDRVVLDEAAANPPGTAPAGPDPSATPESR